ncbi:MAG: M14 family metallopeptidase [Balneolaceae bacterium]
MNRTLLTTFIFFFTALSVAAQTNPNFFRALGSPENPKVEASWNRYLTVEGIENLSRELAEAHPDLIRLRSIGKSYEGRDIWLLTVTNHNNKPHTEKPGYYIDGNIHSNEIQGSEISLYTAWYLAENYEDIDFIRELMDSRVFYIAPTINPDGREHFMSQPNNPNSPRSGVIPVDNDGDGQKSEDEFDDLNNDGHITQMRRKNPRGQWKTDPDDPRRMVRTKPDEFGEYDMLGWEGIDRDGDGRINEDRTGFYDPNRDWGWNWQPDYIQRGAYKYPFSIPENRAVADFVLAHPNIAGAQSYHNTGGMLLRGPGAAEDAGTYNRTDEAVYDFLGEIGEQMMPGYRYMVVHSDLYTVFGGELDWFYGGRGIFTFTNELYTSHMMFGRSAGQADQYDFDRLLLFNDAWVEWEPYDHPQFGEIEIGGFKKNFGRANPGFLLESDAHRNMAFTVFHAYHLPELGIGQVETRDLGGGLREITATITNDRVMPTHASHDLINRITPPNIVSVEGVDVQVGMIVDDPDFGVTTEQKTNPAALRVDNFPGMGDVVVRWIVRGNNRFTIRVESQKGGTVVGQYSM